jgi:hypothetical protein
MPTKMKYSNLLNKDGKHKYWGMYKAVKRFSLDRRIREELTFEQFCRDLSKNFKLSDLNENIIKK